MQSHEECIQTNEALFLSSVPALGGGAGRVGGVDQGNESHWESCSEQARPKRPVVKRGLA